MTIFSFGDKIFKMVKNYLKDLIGLFYPGYCLLDGKKLEKRDEVGLCQSCFEEIKLISPPLCSKCGYSVYTSYEVEGNNSNFICPSCLRRHNYFRFMRSACLYDGVIKRCIHLFKYKKKLALRKPFALLLYKTFSQYLAKDYDFIAAVPLHPFKEFSREFNQAEVLAKDLAQNSGIKYLKNTLKRTKNTKSQTTLSSKQRKMNVKGNFVVSKPRIIKGKGMLLIDDVATTLSTVNECVKILLSSEVKFVDVLTLARG